MSDFIPGLILSEAFYTEAVKPILNKHFPNLKYSVALLGSGSEVLGFDTEQSMDHHWGPRLQLFLSEEGYKSSMQEIGRKLAYDLPVKFKGFSTNWSDPDAIGVRMLENIEVGPVKHRVDMHTVIPFYKRYIGFNPYDEMKPKDWLLIPEQKLSTITSGAVYYDGLGELNKLRKKFFYYPNDIWLYMLASQWDKISQEEPFVGRCGDVGDELGSQVIAVRLINYIMKLCFLMEKKYAPYSKWFGTAFSKLNAAKVLTPLFQKVIIAPTWKEREKYLAKVYEYVAKMHNALEITSLLSTTVSNFHDRSYLVIHGENFSSAILASIEDEEIKGIPLPLGSIDQFIDSVRILGRTEIDTQFGFIYKK